MKFNTDIPQEELVTAYDLNKPFTRRPNPEMLDQEQVEEVIAVIACKCSFSSETIERIRSQLLAGLVAPKTW